MFRRRLALSYCVALVAVCAAKALLSSAAAQTPQHRLFQQPNLPRSSPAFFEFAPTSGTGMGAACACTTPTGAKGEALTFTRASSGTCLKGNITTGIANGDMVTCSTNQPRVMPGGDGTGANGLLVEPAATNDLLRSAELCNAAWADVGTPSCASDAAAGPFGTTTMDSITDNDGAAFEGRSQAITTTSATKHSVSCFVKSSTASAASITMVGAGNGAGDCTGTATGLSTTTSTRISCTSPAAYTGALTAVTVTIRVGTVVGDQGVLYVEGCQHEVGAPYVSSHIATVGAAVTRAADSATFPATIASAIAAEGCVAATVLASGGSLGKAVIDLHSGNNARALYLVNAATNVGFWDGTNDIELAYGTLSQTVQKRFSAGWAGSTVSLRNITDGTSNSGSAALPLTTNQFRLGGANWDVGLGGVIKQVSADPCATRCQ